VPSFVVQEFELYTGYWWEPMATRDITPGVTSGDTTQTYRILYEEVDESEVDIIQVI
jgi:dipeptidyl-peptidase 9